MLRNVKSNIAIHKKHNTLQQFGVYSSNANLFKITLFFSVVYHINRIKEKTICYWMIVDRLNRFRKKNLRNSTFFIVQIIGNSGREGSFLKIIEATYKSLHT